MDDAASLHFHPVQVEAVAAVAHPLRAPLELAAAVAVLQDQLALPEAVPVRGVEAVTGDTNRIMGPGPVPGISGVALNLLRNKRNVCLDLKQPAAVETCLTLMESADAVFEGFRPGVMQRLGLDADSLRARKPGLVYASISSFGQTGPMAAVADGACQLPDAPTTEILCDIRDGVIHPLVGDAGVRVDRLG